MYHDRFSFQNERNVRFDCSFLSVGLPADFLNWLGYQLSFLLIHYWLGYQLIFLIGWAPADFLYSLGLSVSSGWDTSWFSWLVGLLADFLNFLFLTSVVCDTTSTSIGIPPDFPSWVIDLPWPYFFSRIFQRDILDFLSPTDISCAHAGGLFHFRKGQGTYSIDPADYPEKPPFAAAPDNRLLNEFFLLVLRDVRQSLGTLQFTSDEPQFVKELIERVYPAIPSTPNTPALPGTRVFSRPPIAYITAHLPVAPFFRASDTRVTGICDYQYTATLEMLQETDDDKFKMYLTRKW